MKTGEAENKKIRLNRKSAMDMDTMCLRGAIETMAIRRTDTDDDSDTQTDRKRNKNKRWRMWYTKLYYRKHNYTTDSEMYILFVVNASALCV